MTSELHRGKTFETILQALMPEKPFSAGTYAERGMRVDDALSLTYEAMAGDSQDTGMP